MNYKITLPLLALVLIFFAGCAKDETPATAELQENQDVPAHVQAMVDERMNQLQKDYENPPIYDDGISSRSVVYVPAGSVDALQAAINSAGPNGKVVVKSGTHYESGTVTITQMVRLFGEEGAKVYFKSSPGSNFPFVETNVIDPAIHVKNCNQVWIKGLGIYPQGGSGSTGIFLEKGRMARIEDNLIVGFQFGIWASDKSNTPRVFDNTVVGNSPRGVWGIVIESGRSAQLKGNNISKYGACIFASDENGTMSENTTVGGFSGPLLCTVQGNVQLPNGSMLESATPCKDWLVSKNKAYNSTWNYVVIDGANNNFLFRNESFDPLSGQDIYLFGDSYATGGFTPTSFNNFVVNLAGIVTVDCGLNNTVLGGTLLDGPCF